MADVPVTRFGMASSLGAGRASCVAAWARISRPAPLGPFVQDPGTGDVVPIVGCPCPEVAGAEGLGRLLALLRLALDDLGPEPGSAGAEPVPLLVAFPEPDERPETAEQLLAWADGPEAYEARLKAGLAQLRREGEPAWELHAIRSGSAGALLALERGAELVARGAAPWCVVGGVDSLVGEATAGRLYAEGRLHHANQPTGLVPGEAAALLVLAGREATRATGAPLGVVGPFASSEAGYRLTDEAVVPTGRALGRVIDAVIGAIPDAAALAAVLTDHNGETLRAQEWGSAVVRVAMNAPALRTLGTVTPASAFGDVGAAFGAVAACMALVGGQRGRLAPGPVMVCGSSDGGTRAAAMVRVERAVARH